MNAAVDNIVGQNSLEDAQIDDVFHWNKFSYFYLFSSLVLIKLHIENQPLRLSVNALTVSVVVVTPNTHWVGLRRYCICIEIFSGAFL